jgi:ATP-dependent protease HslVU (ClpYQ) peptidase subunit
MITKWFFFDLGILSCPHVLTHPFVFTRVMNVVMIGNGQVTQGAEIIKLNVRKVYKLG